MKKILASFFLLIGITTSHANPFQQLRKAFTLRFSPLMRQIRPAAVSLPHLEKQAPCPNFSKQIEFKETLYVKKTPLPSPEALFLLIKFEQAKQFCWKTIVELRKLFRSP